MEEKEGLKPRVKQQKWLSGFRFWLILGCFLLNGAMLALVFFMRTDGCVICLMTKNEQPSLESKKTLLSSQGQALFQQYQEKSDSELIELLVSDTHVGFGYTEGDLAASLLFDRGFDIEPVMKVFSAWPMPLFEFSSEEQANEEKRSGPCRIFSSLNHSMRSAFQKYIKCTKAPYQLGYVLSRYTQDQDLAFAQEALSHRSTVRLWHAYYQTLGLTDLEAWKALLSMRKEAFEYVPSDTIAILSLFSYFEKEVPPVVIRGLVEQRVNECVSLDDNSVQQFLSALEPFPYVKAKFCFRLLQVPRKGEVHEQAKDALAMLTKDPRLKNISVGKLVAWVKAAKKAFYAPSLPPKMMVEEKKEEPSLGFLQPKSPTLVATAEAKNPAPTLAPRFIQYVVKPGDTVWKIAQKFKIDPNKLISLNELKKGQIQPGQKLRIPSQ